MGILEKFGFGMEKKGEQMQTPTEAIESRRREKAIEEIKKMGVSMESLRHAKVEMEKYDEFDVESALKGAGRPMLDEKNEYIATSQEPKGCEYVKVGVDGKMFEAAKYFYPSADGATESERTAYAGRVDGVDIDHREAKVLLEKLQQMKAALETGGAEERDRIRREVEQERAEQDVREL